MFSNFSKILILLKQDKNMSKNPQITVICYVVFVLIYTLIFITYSGFAVAPLDSSELGGFLSGLFAPLVFLYLILGHKQQEKALNKTNQDLLTQLDIQKTMLQLQLDDKEEREFQLLPIIEIDVKKYDSPEAVWDASKNAFISNYNNAIPTLEIQLKNSGSEVLYFSCNILSPLAKSLKNKTKFIKDEVVKIKVPLDNLKYGSNGKIKLTFQNDYITSTGIPYFNSFEVNLFENKKNYLKFSSFGPQRVQTTQPQNT